MEITHNKVMNGNFRRKTPFTPKSISSLTIGLLLVLTILTSTGLAAPAHADDPTAVFYVAPFPVGTGTSGGVM